jgi:hypothetical protein
MRSWWTLRRLAEGMCSASCWLWIETGGVLYWKRWWIFVLWRHGVSCKLITYTHKRDLHCSLYEYKLDKFIDYVGWLTSQNCPSLAYCSSSGWIWMWEPWRLWCRLGITPDLSTRALAVLPGETSGTIRRNGRRN